MSATPNERQAALTWTAEWMKRTGASAYRHWPMTLEFAAWIAGEHPKYRPPDDAAPTADPDEAWFAALRERAGRRPEATVVEQESA